LLLFSSRCFCFRSWRKLFYRSGFPLRNSAQILALRRRIEKKKTIKRMKAAASGKLNVKIESSDDDYEVSDNELATPEGELTFEGKATSSNGNGSSAASTAPRFSAATSSRFARASANDGEKKEPEKSKKPARRKFEEDE
jgi:hypothetical protein